MLIDKYSFFKWLTVSKEIWFVLTLTEYYLQCKLFLQLMSTNVCYMFIVNSG